MKRMLVALAIALIPVTVAPGWLDQRRIAECAVLSEC
jgi:hypothetical protein